MTITRVNPDKTGNVVDMVVGKFNLTFSNSTDANLNVTFPRALPSGKNYIAVVTLNQWISPYDTKPVYSVRRIDNTGMNVHGALPKAYSGTLAVPTGYIAIAY